MKPGMVLELFGQAESHPVRVRGLKQLSGTTVEIGGVVAPRAGAWVETDSGCSCYRERTSHPVRVRGLKHL